jgi:hypothetical protein
MNILPARLEALEALGYTQTEARFLYIVATHSGYFVARQFLVFTGAHWGKRTTLFWNRLKNNRHARTECFPQRGVVYHLFSRRLYRQIEKENLRNRRAHELDFIQRRIAMLDFVIQNQSYQYLETEPDKVRFFCGTMNIAKQHLPARLYLGQKTSRTSVRYFVDKFPMFLGRPARVVNFTYIHEGGPAFAEFVRHLETYLPLFRELPEFRLMYVSRSGACFAKAADIFSSLVKIPLESEIACDLLRYFRVRRAWDEKRYGSVEDADLIFRNHARIRFGGERFEGLYRGWKNGRVSEDGVAREVGIDDRKRKVEFETFLLSPSAVGEQKTVAAR